MGQKKTQRKKGGDRKIGRKLAKCKVYRDRNRREINKARKARKEANKRRKKAEKLARRLKEKGDN